LQHFEKTNDDRCYNQRTVVARGQKVKKGDTLIEGASINHKSLILDALEECMDISLDNMPKLKGKTMIELEDMRKKFLGFK
jgi:DNA-directed RNA polymerase beta subunit